MKKIFQFSSDTMGGFQVIINLDNVNTIKDIEQICAAQLLQFLYRNNLKEILLKMQDRTFFVHDLTMDEIKTSKSSIFYICDSCASHT